MESTEFQRKLEHVEKTCFGWLDEKDPECRKHCELEEPCRKARNKKLREYARLEERRDALSQRYKEKGFEIDVIF